RPRLALPGLHGAERLRAFGGARRQQKTGRNLENAELAALRPLGRRYRAAPERQKPRFRQRPIEWPRGGAADARPTEGARRGFPHLMTTLVTGATGFVGTHVARRVVASGDSVRVVVRRTSRVQA